METEVVARLRSHTIELGCPLGIAGSLVGHSRVSSVGRFVENAENAKPRFDDVEISRLGETAERLHLKKGVAGAIETFR